MWVPAGNAHAIEQVTLAFVFSEKVPLKMLDASLEHVDEERDKGTYSVKGDVTAANIQVKVGAENEVRSQNDKMGYAYFVDQDGTVEGARFTKELAVISSVSYGTWSGFKEEYERVMVPFLKKVLLATSLRAVKLEYSDRFVFDGDPSAADVSQIVETSKLGLPDNAFGQGFPWHSRRGWFVPADNGAILVNLDIAESQVAHRDEPQKPLLSIHLGTMLEARFDAHVDDVQELNNIVEQLHNQSKGVTRSALTVDAANMIGLEDVA
ncbi:TIGR04255 family protein [Arenibacterium sp. LLYu02]|uniref:TIGR04255 family protein n=1 Tax=Arenibacterium sp. LLYu02 TaxID=3404132 RepID=UPI003B2137B1